MPQPKNSRFKFQALGTFWEVVTERPLSTIEKAELHQLVERFDATYSRFRADSLVTQMAQAAGTFAFPSGDEVLFELYEQLYTLSLGLVSPLVGGLMEDLGYDAKYSFVPKVHKRSVPDYAAVMSRRGTVLTTTQPVVLDVGAAGKGYLVDLIATWLKKAQHKKYIIDASGDILHKGMPPEVVGLHNPFSEGSVIGVVSLKDNALCGSAVTRRRWGGGVHHIVNPQTGLSTNSYQATWVIAKTAMIADGLATALFFCDPLDLKKQYTYEYVRVGSDGSAEYSPYFKALLY
jgi:thiamine biosynthesis lipoprotein